MKAMPTVFTAVSIVAFSAAVVPAKADTLTLPTTGFGTVNGAGLKITNTQAAIGATTPFAIVGLGTGKKAGGVEGMTTRKDSVGVVGANSGTGFGGSFSLTGPNTVDGDSALEAIHSGGNPSINGPYGNAGYFQISNIHNTDTAVYVDTAGNGNGLHAQIRGVGGALSAIEGYDYSSGGGAYGVFGYSDLGTAAHFIHGAGGSGHCDFDGGSDWSCSSDRNLKENFRPADLDELLERLDRMPVYYYQMKGSVRPTRYLGPTAQDFKAAFDLGDSDTMINGANAKGVALAAAQGLYRRLKTDEAEIAALKQELAAERIANSERIARLEAMMAKLAPGEPVREAALTAH